MQSPSDQKKIQHLFSRAAFGISIQELQQRKGQSLVSISDELFRESDTFTALAIVDTDPMDTMKPMERKELSAEARKKLRQERKRSLFDLNLAWATKLWTDPARLRERMTFFWHGHFACRLESPYAMQDLNNIHRKYALGNFKDLLMAVSKSPAMLQFLNNQQNKKMHPNENFAREVMELFTLGRGNYTENDIKEAARAFTGWGFERETEAFVFRERMHDEGSKTFLGKTGDFKGEDIIDILLEKKETAHFICRKIYRFFVNDQPDEKRIAELTTSFYGSNYDIAALMKEIFNSTWFYQSQHIGALIKSPVDLLVGMNRLMSIAYEDKDGLLVFQRGLGQTLFYPPNVSGWAGGKSWIDSSSLMFRLKAPSMLLNEGHIDLVPKDDLLDVKAGMMHAEKAKGKNKFHASADWNSFLASIPAGCSKEELIRMILVPEATESLLKNLPAMTTANHREFVMELLSAPEYQMG
jgi:uncharacterized protein (DUF1800 family)